MADIELVVKVPEEWLEGTQPNLYDVMGAVMNGTVLPEHHGRLIDVDELLDDIGLEDNDENRDCNMGEIITLEDIDRISTIIRATKEGDGK